MIEFGNVFLVISNVVLLASAALAICTGIGWKQTAQRHERTIDNYQVEVAGLRKANQRLTDAVNALSREDE